jgi:Flp pilus assembly protein TadG
MNGTQLSNRPHHKRRGTTIVETALVLPLFLMFIFVLMEFGHAQMIKNMLQGACREAARLGSTEGATSTDVQNRVRQIVGGAISPSHVTVLVKDAGAFDSGSSPPNSASQLAALPNTEVSDAEQGQLILVRATVNYNDVAIVPITIPFVGDWLKNVTLDGQAFVRHE